MLTPTNKCNCVCCRAGWSRCAYWLLLAIGIATICGGMVYYAYVMTR